MRASILRQMIRFGAVGVVGYVVDTAVLYAFLYIGLGPYAGRLISYLAAVTCTWHLNRRYTFRVAAPDRAFSQWGRFALSQLCGAVVNLGVYATLIHDSHFVARYPAVGVAIGSLLGMSANYLAARRYAFADDRAAGTVE